MAKAKRTRPGEDAAGNFPCVCAADLPPPPPSAVKLNRRWIDIHYLNPHGRKMTYDFELSRCATPEKLLGWLSHLSHKEWFTTVMACDLISAVAGHFGWEIHGL